MRHLAALLAVAGIALAAWLFAREGVGGIVGLVVAAGPGLVLVALVHLMPMIANARAWGLLLPRPLRPGMGLLLAATWIRESINGLLPVARIGGEIAAFRLLRQFAAAGRNEVAASLVADMALSVVSQAGFAALGLALLLATGYRSPAAAQLAAGAIGLLALGVAFALAQRGGALGAATGALDRLFAGRLGLVHSHSLRFDEALRAVYSRRGEVAACVAWQLAGWMLGALEIALALYYLGQPRSLLDAVAIEALIQALSSAAFLVPGALGVQEGGFVVICGALGIDAATALALATARRLRDAIVFFPGLLAWHWAEARARDRGSDPASPSS